MNKSFFLLTVLASAIGGAWAFNTYHTDAQKGYASPIDEDLEPEGFEPFPISVSGTGRVKAVPDIAVITGTITAEHDFDHGAIDAVSKIINAVQTSVKDQDVELNFTQINMQEKRDDDCLAYNDRANARHWQITRDNQHNQRVKRLREQGQKTSLKLKPPKRRMAQKTCDVTHIEAKLSFSARISPADKAGDIINGFSQAGVGKVDLFGYDFSDYDALYKQASVKAVKNAEDKAKMVANISGSTLTDIVGFSISAPARQKRIGPQAMIISNHANRPAPKWKTITEPIIIQEASTELMTIPATYETVTETVVIQEGYGSVPPVTKQVARRVVKTPASTQERTIPAVTKMETRRVLDRRGGQNYGDYSGGYSTGNSTSFAAYAPPPPPPPALTVANWDGSLLPAPQPVASEGLINQPSLSVPQNNALRMTMLAGPQTVTVSANLQYLYETPLNGLVIVDE